MLSETLATNKLKEHGIMPTLQRLMVARAILDKHQHLSADDVMQKMEESNTRVSKATVYNALNLFSRKGLVKEVVIDGSRVYYDTNNTHHHHFYHKKTDELIDIDEKLIDVTKLPKPPKGKRIYSYQMMIRID